MLINDILNEIMLSEAAINMINAGKNDIPIIDSDGKEVDNINSFDKIMNLFLTRHVFTARSKPEIKKWFSSNFYNWIKNGADDRSNDIMDEDKFQRTFYVSLDEYISDLLANERKRVNDGTLSKEIVLDSFPDFVKRNPDGAIIFSGGRLFRLKKIIPSIEKLHDFLIAVINNLDERDDVIMPPAFMFKRLDVVQVPEALKRAYAWHEYVENKEKEVSYAQAKALVKDLVKDKDYKVIEDLGKGITIVQLLTKKSASIEGEIMKHCVASYGHDIEQGKSTVYSLRDSNEVPQATIELTKKGKYASQVKGPHNTTVRTEYHDVLRDFFKRNNISVSGDSRHFGGMKDDKERIK